MKSEIVFMRRVAKIAGNTQCWIGIGCVIAKGGKILVEAWNETLPGEEFCAEFRKRRASKGSTLAYAKVEPYQINVGCIRYELGLSQGREIEKSCSVHAEVNAIATAARRGIKIDGAAMFVTSFPCLICMRAIVSAGIKKVVYMNDFYKSHHLEILRENEIEIDKIPEEKVWGSKNL